MRAAGPFAITAALFCVSALASAPGHPGMLNYVEGDVRVDGRQMTPNSVGTADVQPGRVLETERGRAELLLTPGVFLRLGENSAVRMISPGLTDTRVALLQGEATLEVTELHRENHLQVTQRNADTTVEKTGLYDFDANRGTVAVFDGKAKVQEGDAQLEVKKGHEANLANLQESKFNTKEHDALYDWSNVRSEYLAEASAQSARSYLVNGGGWYWNPFWNFYSFVPGNGLLYSPFGWGFYSPSYMYYRAPRYYSRAYGYRTPAVRSNAALGFRGNVVRGLPVAPRTGAAGYYRSGGGLRAMGAGRRR